MSSPIHRLENSLLGTSPEANRGNISGQQSCRQTEN